MVNEQTKVMEKMQRQIEDLQARDNVRATEPPAHGNPIGSRRAEAESYQQPQARMASERPLTAHYPENRREGSGYPQADNSQGHQAPEWNSPAGYYRSNTAYEGRPQTGQGRTNRFAPRDHHQDVFEPPLAEARRQPTIPQHRQ